MRRVFVVQQGVRCIDDPRPFVHARDVSAAKRYGEIVQLLEPHARGYFPSEVIRILTYRLSSFHKTQDHLLLCGDPLVMASALAIAADQTGGVIQLLEWDPPTKGYRSVRVNVFPFDD